LAISYLGHHKELRQNGNCFKINGESPENLHDRELMIDEQREGSHRDQKEFHPESVMIAVIGSTEFNIH